MSLTKDSNGDYIYPREVEQPKIYVSEIHKVTRDPSWSEKYIAYLFCENRRELHDFAFSIGIHPSFFINHPHFPCYKLTQTMRYKAINHKAVALEHEAFSLKIRQSTASAEVSNGT